MSTQNEYMLKEPTIRSLLEFRKERDWEQFHTPRNLAISISLEAAELLEVFQWIRDEQESDKRVPECRAELEEEVADLAIYLSYLVNDLGIDLDAAVQRKLAKNASKYPVASSKGNADKYRK